MIEKLYTVEEVAEMASVTGRTIRNYLKSGRLVGRKIGGQWRFPEGEVQRLLTGGTPQEDDAEDWPPHEEAPYRAPQGLSDDEDGAAPEVREAGAGYHPPPVRLPAAAALPRAGHMAHGVLAPPHTEQPPAPAAYPPAPPAGGFATYEQPPVRPQAPAAYLPAPPAGGFAAYEGPAMPPPAAYAGGDGLYYEQSAPAGAPPPSAGQPPAPAAPGYAPPPSAGQPPAPAAPGYAQPPSAGQPPAPAAQPYVPPVYAGAAPACSAGGPVQPAQPAALAPQGPLVHPYAPAGYAPAAPAQPPPAGTAPQEGAGTPQAEQPPPAARKEKPAQDVSPHLSDVGKRVETFISAVHDCSHGPAVCTVVDLHQSLAAAKATSERLVLIADEESASGQLCQSYVEFDDRYFIARYTLFGPTPFLLRCLKLIG